MTFAQLFLGVDVTCTVKGKKRRGAVSNQKKKATCQGTANFQAVHMSF